MHPESGCWDCDVSKSLDTMDSSLWVCAPEEGKVPREVFLFCWNRTLKVYGELVQFTWSFQIHMGSVWQAKNSLALEEIQLGLSECCQLQPASSCRPIGSSKPVCKWMLSVRTCIIVQAWWVIYVSDHTHVSVMLSLDLCFNWCSY